MKYPYTTRLAFFEDEDGRGALLVEEKDAKYTKWGRATHWAEVTFVRLPVAEEIASKLTAIEKEEMLIQDEINRQVKKLAVLRDRKNTLLPTRVDNFVDIEPETCSNGGVELGQPPQSK